LGGSVFGANEQAVCKIARRYLNAAMVSDSGSAGIERLILTRRIIMNEMRELEATIHFLMDLIKQMEDEAKHDMRQSVLLELAQKRHNA
jgi:hypothetical protein